MDKDTATALAGVGVYSDSDSSSNDDDDDVQVVPQGASGKSQILPPSPGATQLICVRYAGCSEPAPELSTEAGAAGSSAAGDDNSSPANGGGRWLPCAHVHYKPVTLFSFTYKPVT